MMLPTHILAGGTIGLVLSVLAPEMQSSMIITGMLAGILPDLDMFFEHRKTLHRPLQFSLTAITLFGVYLALNNALLLALSAVFASAGLHTVSEILGQGKTMNPDLKKDDRCVYNHINGSWINPVRLIKVGSFRDLTLSAIFSAPLLILGTRLISALSIFILSIGLIQFLLNDWLTKNVLSDYDRFSEVIQERIGYGPELKNN